jgi:polyisoprenoid-binding protein YceI
MKIIKLGLISILATGVLYAGTYKVDTAHSYVGFKVKHMMVSNVKGNFEKFEGVIEYDEANKVLTALKGTIQVASINTADEKRDTHLKAPDMFDAQKYPTIVFEASKIDGDDVYGNLTMHGVTKEVKLELEESGLGEDAWGNQKVGLSLEGKINRKDFGITWNKLLEAGGVAVSDEVKLELELAGVLQK